MRCEQLAAANAITNPCAQKTASAKRERSGTVIGNSSPFFLYSAVIFGGLLGVGLLVFIERFIFF
jgi:hypothetical protein